MTDNKDKATIYAVAKNADVSVATVSRVFNHTGLVKEDTVRRVVDAAKALNYKIDIVDKLPSQTKKRSPREHELLILNVPSLNNPFYNEIIKGAKSAAELHQYDMLINQGHIRENNITGYIKMLNRVNAKGIIMLNHLSSLVLKTLADAIPTVQCCEYEEDADISSVSIDDLAAAKMVMEHLLSAGRKKIAFINGPPEYKYARHRSQGYYESMENAGIRVNPNWVLQLSDISADMAFSAVAQMLSQPEIPDAFFTVSDVFAAAVVRAARYNQYRVPEDIIVIGFDNVDISTVTTPSLTTVNQPKFQLGFIACEMLMEKLANPQAQAQHMLLHSELIVRESTLLPPRGTERVSVRVTDGELIR